jgi:uncharacterized protein (TIGR00266 family)
MEAGQKIYAEPGSMASMSTDIELKAGLKGGLFKSLGRALGGESLVINTYTAKSRGEVTFAPGPMGDLEHYRLDRNSLILQKGGFVAHGEGVDLAAKWEGAKGFFSGEGMVLLKASGTGDIFFSTYGAIIEIDVAEGYLVDTGYVVAFEDTLNYSVTVVPGLGPGAKLKSFFFGGERLVCQFHGQGRVWIQTRCITPFLRWVYGYRRRERSSN